MKFSKKKKIHNSNPVRLYTIFQCNDKSIRFNSMFKLKKKKITQKKILLELLSIAENLFSKKASFIFRSEESPKLSSFSSNCDSSFRGYIDKYIIVYYSINQERERVLEISIHLPHGDKRIKTRRSDKDERTGSAPLFLLPDKRITN